MKKLLLLSVIFLFAGITAFSQVPGEKIVPQKVKDQYAADFPAAKLRRWERKGLDFVAHMEDQNKTAWVRYAKDGKQRWVCHSWPGKDIPATIIDPILKDYPGFTPNWATETDNPNTKKHQYLVHLTKPGFILKVLMNSDGTYAGEDNADLGEDGNDK